MRSYKDRDSLRFHWIRDQNPKQIETHRFSRALFDLNQSPFLLQGTIHQHLDNAKVTYPEDLIVKIRSEVCVDDIISGGETYEDAKALKETLIKLFGDAGFAFHKWHSSISDFANSANKFLTNDWDFVTKQFVIAPSDFDPYEHHVPTHDHDITSLLELQWNKSNDTIAVKFPKVETVCTKKHFLQTLASVFNPLGITLLGKLIYRDICDSKMK